MVSDAEQKVHSMRKPGGGMTVVDPASATLF